ncbi:hypothetical protein GCM10007973_29840 [Polymorphobacter multimanifer]|uniref:RES domain-containing protein n=1 Tax=Polymorphobacter multimanifer TaxID=1070431 RepID=A0A841LAI7_9SPHN|nr:RES domain-containing protein [Polymorphobacter multimanifer]MBB6229450.1 RES domain-containing protein [Polymorphobacter multimanifer]GGI91597.1 hypothetical protein GCM10007973_29840 [Polymorphobacter multimanifer]
MNRWALADAPRKAIAGRWWRMLSPRWHHDPLSGAGAARAGGRWNAPGMAALYLSADHGTAIAEYMQALIHPGTLAPYYVKADAILDLTDADVRKQAGIEQSMLTLPWRRIRDIDRAEPASWHMAREALLAGFAGCRVPSVQGRGINLVLWCWGEIGAQVTLIDPTGDLRP